MEKRDIKTIIKDQIEDIRIKAQTENIINRAIDIDIYSNKNIALFILGVRRCGKSTLAVQLFKNTKFGYINFDDERLIGADTGDLNLILQSFYELFGENLENIIFDEIQNVKGWEKFISRLRQTKRIIVTGSNSKMLSGELSTSLTGRHVDFVLYPFSFKEFLKFKGIKIRQDLTTLEKANINNLLNEYLENGGFPELFKYGWKILNSIYNDIILKDILQRYNIKHIESMREIAFFLISNSAQEFTYSSLKNITKVKNHITIANWVKYLESTYLIFSLNRFSFKLKEMILAPKKVYAIDTGLVNLFGFKSDKNMPRLMETAVAIEIKRCIESEADHNKLELYYWKNHSQKEIDFVIKDGKNIKQLIQVTYAFSRVEIRAREIDNLIAASSDLKCKNLLVITSDYEGEEKIEEKTIRFIPIWKWLLFR